MPVTQQEAINILKRRTTIPGEGFTYGQINEAIDMAIAALRPVSREQVEKVWRGEWKCHGDCGVTECSACGWNIEEYVGDYNFCPACGAAQTDEAVEMVMERMDALHDTEN